MQEERRQATSSRRHGLFAWRRQKEWWSFEGFDPESGLYFVLLLLKTFPTWFVSLKVVTTGDKRIRSLTIPGKVTFGGRDDVDIEVGGKKGTARCRGSAEEGWHIVAEAGDVSLDVRQSKRAGDHRNRLLTRRIDYNILQFVWNDLSGECSIGGRKLRLDGFGYYEHAWGVQPRHSTANWMHFWGERIAGVIMSCYYDAGVPHHYTYVWRDGAARYLSSPAQFLFQPGAPEAPWSVKSPELDLRVLPIVTERSVMQIPPLLPLVSIDYYEQLAALEGELIVGGRSESLSSGSAKFDHNFNFW